MRQITTPRGIEHTDRAIKAVAKQHGIKATDLFAFSALPATRRRQAEVIWRARGEGVAWPDVAEAMGITIHHCHVLAQEYPFQADRPDPELVPLSEGLPVRQKRPAEEQLREATRSAKDGNV